MMNVEYRREGHFIIQYAALNEKGLLRNEPAIANL
jgi:hypothetical protein